MKIITVSDSFKGTLTSKEVGIIVSNHFKKQQHETSYIPISDGGEGFLDVIEYVLKLKKQSIKVYDPMFRETIAHYIIDDENKTAYLELAEASGITKLKDIKPKTYFASTYGLGQVIKHVILNHKIKKVVLGIGGSATSDMGVGMLEALGVEFIDRDGFVIKRMNNMNIAKIRKIDTKLFKKLIKKIEFVTLSDVTNPLLGENGSISVFAPQKGATSEDLLIMEKNLKHLYKKLNIDTNYQMPDFPGAGAAGGVGYCMKYFFNSKVENGISAILKLVNFEEEVKKADIIISGEGKFDSQSFGGKVISGIKKYNPKRLVIICGISEVDQNDVYPIVPKYATVEESLNNPKESLEKLLKNIVL